jgi:hypothetical protein
MLLRTDKVDRPELASVEKYVASFQRVGAIYEETITLLSHFARDGDWNAVKEKVFQENLLKKSSSAWIKDILGAVEYRFFTSKSSLPSSMEISKFVSSNVSKSSKIQALYQYICDSDPLLESLITGLVAPLLLKYGISELTKKTYYEFLTKESESHSELLKWSASVSGKWQRNFFAFLRVSGIMERKPSLKIIRPVIRIEPFTFFLLGFLESGLVPVEAIKHQLWGLYFLKEPEKERLLVEAQGHGWIYYSRAGDVVELKPRFPSLREWLEHGLEY